MRAHLEPAGRWLLALQPYTHARANPQGPLLEPALVRGMPLGLAHGDFWSRNLLLRDGAVGAVLDWEHARESRPATEDLFHLVLTYGLDYRWLGRAGVDTAESFRRAFLEDSPVGREIARALRLYCEGSGVDGALLRPLFELHLSASEAHRRRAPVLLDALRRARWTVFPG